MSGVGGHDRRRERPFEDVVKGLLREVEDFSKLEDAIVNFSRSLRSLLEGNKFWMSEAVTDKSGCEEWECFKPNFKGLRREVERSLKDTQDQSGRLKKVREEVQQMAQAFEKLREDMLNRILECAKTSHSNDKNSDIDLVVPSAPLPAQEKEETMRELDLYTPQKYFWLVFGGIIFRKALFTNILNIIGFTLFLHFVPVFQQLRAMCFSQDMATNEAFLEKAANCPIISLFKKPIPRQMIKKERDKKPPVSTHPPDGLNAEVQTAASRTEAHIRDTDGPFVMTGAIETPVDGTPTLAPRL